MLDACIVVLSLTQASGTPKHPRQKATYGHMSLQTNHLLHKPKSANPKSHTLNLPEILSQKVLPCPRLRHDEAHCRDPSQEELVVVLRGEDRILGFRALGFQGFGFRVS